MKKSFILYYDQYKTVKLLSQEEKWELLDAIYQSHNWWIEFEMSDKVELVFSMMESSFQRNNEKREDIKEKRRLAWSLGGKQKVANVANASKSKQKVANVAVSGSVSVSVSGNTTIEDSSLVVKYFQRFESKPWQIDSRIQQLIEYCKLNWHTIDVDWGTETIDREWDVPLVRRKKIKETDRKFVENKIIAVNAWETKAKREIKNPLTTLYTFMKK